MFPTMKTPFLSQLHPTPSDNQPALWFIFKAEEVLLSHTKTIPTLTDVATLQLEIKQQHYLGMYGNQPCYAAEVSAIEKLPDGMVFQSIRPPYELGPNEDFFLLASRARQVLNWGNATQFCGHCGQKTEPSPTERAKICTGCKALFYPQIAPVALALIFRGNELLLARSPHFQKGIYALLAGFVEPGETLEHALAREVREEVGISIKNITYFGSQPWPFPSNLMLGFIAEYDQGEIVMDPVEIEDARWFSIHALPPLPSPVSLSRQMIDAFLSSSR